jgi:hypothetical protein
MAWFIHYDPDQATLVLRQSGDLSLDEAKEQAKAVISFLKETTASRLLLDYSHARLRLSADDLASLPPYYASLLAPRDRKMAVVLPRAEKEVHACVYHKMKALVCGYDFVLFHDTEKATEWLRESSLAGRRLLPTPTRPGRS